LQSELNIEKFGRYFWRIWHKYYICKLL
jgi:hypothetical protein